MVRKALTLALGVLVALLLVRSWPGAVEQAPPAATIPVVPAPDAAIGNGAAPAAAPDVRPGLDRQLVAVQRRAPSIAGRVVQDGAPLTGIDVHAIARFRLNGEADAGHDRSDGDGRFVIGALEPGGYALVCDGEAVPREPPHAFVQAGQRFELGDLEVPRSGSITGRVVDAAGPRAGVRVIVRLADTENAPALRAGRGDQVASTDATGRYRVAQLLPGPHAVIAQDARSRDTSTRTTVVAGDETGVADLVLQPGRELRGFVRDAGGRPVAGAKVTAGRMLDSALQRAAIADRDGAFALQGLDSLHELTVEAAGFDTLDLRSIDFAAQPLQLVLAPATAVTGTVLGCGGAETVLVVEPELDANRRMPPISAYAVLQKPLPVAADGSFRIKGLPAASYSVFATARGVGRSRPVPFAVPCREPLRLAIVPGRQVAVVVRDDLGVPLQGVELLQADTREFESIYRPDDPELVGRILGHSKSAGTHVVAGSTDAAGRARLLVQPEDRLAFAGRRQGYVPTAASFAAGEVPEDVELVLPRAGQLAGTIDDPSGREHYWLTVVIWPAGDDAAKKKAALQLGIDARGGFCSGPLRPGRWCAALHRGDRSWTSESARDSAIVGLLGEGTDERGVAEIDVPPNGLAEVTLTAPRVTELTGVVHAGGEPLADVVVTGAPAGAECRTDADPQLDMDPRKEPRAVTGRDGRFRFLVGRPGSYDLRACHPRQVVAGPPVQVRVAGERVDVALELPGGVVRGRCTESGANAAYLYPPADAAGDPFFQGDEANADASARRHVPIGVDGTFGFEFVPPGDYVLRLVHLGDRWSRDIALQQIVHVGERGADLGTLAVPARVTASVPVICTGRPADSQLAAWIRMESPAVPDGMFVRTAFVADGRLPLGRLPAGRYRIEFFEPTVFAGAIGVTGSGIGRPHELELRTDGTTGPARLSVD
jgi:hypothetical protein